MLRTAMCLLALVIAASDAICQLGPTTQRYGYVFSPDQRYVVVDLAAGRVIRSGKIAEVVPVGRPFVAFFGGNLLLQGIEPADKNTPEPRAQLAVLKETREPRGVRLSFERWLPLPTSSSSVLWAALLLELFSACPPHRTNGFKPQYTTPHSSRLRDLMVFMLLRQLA